MTSRKGKAEVGGTKGRLLESRGQHGLKDRRREQRHHRPRKRYGERLCLGDTGRMSARKTASVGSERQGTPAWLRR